MSCRLARWLGFFAVAMNGGCTFYSSCPSCAQPGATAAAGSAGETSPNAGTGGNADAGTGGDAGTVNGTGGDAGMGGGAVPTGPWLNATGNLADMPSECGNLSHLAAKPDENMLIAGVALHGLWSSRDGGKSWRALGTGAGSDEIINRLTAIVFDPLDSNHYWESGIYNGAGAYETSDNGRTFVELGNVTHTDYLSIDFSDPERKTMLAGVHEQVQTLNLSVDGGMTWSAAGQSLPKATQCTTPLLINPSTFLIGCVGVGGGPSGIFRTQNAGKSWASVTDLGGATVPLRALDDSIYWPGHDSIVRSTDDGKTWGDELGKGLVRRVSPIELPDGRLATLGLNNVIVSADQGRHWQLASSQLPYDDPAGLAYSAQEKAFFVWHLTCGFDGPIPVPTDAIMRYDFDYTSE